MFFKSCCGSENSFKRFGDKDKGATDECYTEVAERFSKVPGKYNYGNLLGNVYIIMSNQLPNSKQYILI